MIKIGLIQSNFCVGDIEGNSAKILASLKKAKARSIDIAVFPELALTGYPPQDLLHKKYFIKKNIDALKKLAANTDSCIAIVGFVHASPDYSKIYNAYAMLQNGKVVDIYSKMNLPNYGVFDEKRYFKHGWTVSTYNFGGMKFSANICEDIWRKSYVRLLTGKGFDFIINLSASPFHLGKISFKQDILSFAARTANTYVLYCNLVGGQDDLVFDGTSMVVSPKGEIVKVAKRFEEDFLEVTLPLKRYKAKVLNESEPQAVFHALNLGIKDYVRKNGFKKVIVGMSGGIDSAVTATLATLALGKDNVHALLMPSRFTSKATFSDAQLMCKRLRIKHSIVPIDDIFDTYRKELKTSFKKLPPDATEENIQARIRGNLLMAFSNKFGYLVLNTGNKSELSCGYCTLYGDLVGGFGVLSDIPKTLVYKLAHYINRHTKKSLILPSIIKRQPTAELTFNQKDADALGSYEMLDPVLKLYIEDDLSLGEIIERGVDKKLARKVIKMVDENEYKRRQAPPGIKITPRAFGRDRRMPITNKFYH